MMESLRKHMKKIMWAIALMFIVGIFFWYGSGKSTNDIIVKIGKGMITGRDYRLSVARQIRVIRDNSETEIGDEQILEIRRQVLGSMINQQILFSEAKKLGIVVTDEEIVNTIHNLPQFQQEGKFSFQLYHQALSYSLGMSPEAFENDIRKNITVRKLERRILGTADIGENELHLYYVTRNLPKAEYAEKKEELKNELLQEKRMAIYKNWMQNLQQKYKLDVNTELAGL